MREPSTLPEAAAERVDETPSTGPSAGPLAPRSRVEIELDRLRETLLDMAGRAEELVRLAMVGLSERDARRTKAVRRDDDRIDALEVEIDERVVELLARHNPRAGDLRLVFVALKASNDVERIGDHAVNIAKASRRIAAHPPLPEVLEVWEMGDQVRAMLSAALGALVNRDAEAARMVVVQDKRVDDMRRSAFRIIVSYMLEQPRYISPGLEMILVVQNLERIGDLATNIAEDVVFLVEGKSIKHTKVEPGA